MPWTMEFMVVEVEATRADSRAPDTAITRTDTSSAMIPITTTSSTSVKPAGCGRPRTT